MSNKKQQSVFQRVDKNWPGDHLAKDEAADELLESLSSYYDALDRSNDTLEKLIQENLILQAKYQHFYEDAPVGYLIFSVDGQIADANNTFCAMLNLAKEAVIGQAVTDFFQPAQQAALRQACQALSPGAGQLSLESVLACPQGQVDVLLLLDCFQAQSDAHWPLATEDGRLLRCVVNDISELKRRQREMWQKSMHDALTGVYNRLFYAEQLPHLDQERHLPLSVIMLDIDRLKTINDTLGHDFGDEAIVTIAQIMQTNARPMDYVCRIGGDEMVVLLPNTDFDRASAYAAACQEEAARHALSGLPLGFSWGAATRLSLADSLSTTIASAEDMMYTRKHEHNTAWQNNTIRTIMQSLFERNPRVYQHCARVGNLAQRFGHFLNLPPDECTFLLRLGLLHDIGMASLSSDILNQATPLTEAQLRELHRHPEIGARILRQNPSASEFAQIVYAHHENWQGGGYPTGLSSEKLPFASRLLRILDTYDCLRNHLTGGPGCDLTQAIHTLQSHSGQSLDPQLTERFIAFLEQLTTAEESYLIGTQAPACAIHQDLGEQNLFSK